MTAPIRSMPDCITINIRRDLVGQPWEVSFWRRGKQNMFLADEWWEAVQIIERFALVQDFPSC